MTLYFGIGASVAVVRLLLERAGKIQYPRQDAVWFLAVAFTDVLWWPLVLLVLLLQRMAPSTSS